ncbi:MAG TPA: hypothetical protein VFZ15_00310, partial [Acidimicrobiia bacterium]|nr:hypothetical protein [Acidimicrobiia bacterium]
MNLAHPAWPPPVSRPWVAGAVLTFTVTVTVSTTARALPLVSLLVLWLALKGRVVVAVLATLAAVTALLASAPLEPLAPGPISGEAVLATDVIQGRYGPYALVDMGDGLILANLPMGAEGALGELVWLQGSAVGDPGTIRGRRYRGAVGVREFVVLSGARTPVMAMGNAIRDRVTTRLAPLEEGRG